MSIKNRINRQCPWISRVLKAVFTLSVVYFSVRLTISLLLLIMTGSGASGQFAIPVSFGLGLSERYNNYISNALSTAADGFIKIEKVYMLSDNNPVAPEPDQSKYATSENPEEVLAYLEGSRFSQDSSRLLLKPDTKILKGSKITYYLDDTIQVVTWKEVIRHAVYTFSEIKIAHPSQFRRFLADNTFGSERQYLTSQMSRSVNAVMASAGDFYKYRSEGIVVYNGKVERFNVNTLDTCFIDDQGDLIFSKAKQFSSKEEVQKYVDDHNIRFSLCFGPIIIEDGQTCVPKHYHIGEIYHDFSRAALCQLGQLHYLVVTANDEKGYDAFPNLFVFTNVLHELGIENAYTLDGGQTATIVMNDQVINHVSYGAERLISDILYFATAIPD